MGTVESHAILDLKIQDYLDLTFLTRGEILHAYHRFHQLDPKLLDANNEAAISIEKVIQIPELKVNPFRERICKVFSSNDRGDLTFEDFLDMVSAFSEASPTEIKIEYAFRIYDFDDDGMLNDKDIEKVVKLLTKGQKQVISEEDLKTILDKIFTEADLDGDRQLSYAEFEHAMMKSADFASTYRIRL